MTRLVPAERLNLFWVHAREWLEPRRSGEPSGILLDERTMENPAATSDDRRLAPVAAALNLPLCNMRSPPDRSAKVFQHPAGPAHFGRRCGNGERPREKNPTPSRRSITLGKWINPTAALATDLNFHGAARRRGSRIQAPRHGTQQLDDLVVPCFVPASPPLGIVPASKPRSRYSLTSSMRPHRQAQPSGVDLSSGSRFVNDGRRP